MSEQRRDYGRSDSIGTWAPVGSSGAEKDLFRFPQEVEKVAPAATVMLRGRIPEKLRGHYGLIASLAGNHPPTLAFIANMQAASLGLRGLARAEFEMALARMLVPTSMPSADLLEAKHHDISKRSKKDGAGADE